MSEALVQQLIVIAIVLVAGAYLASKALKAITAVRRKRAGACSSGCGCEPTATERGR